MVRMQLLWVLTLFLPLHGVQHIFIPSSKVVQTRNAVSGDMTWVDGTLVDFTISSWMLYDSSDGRDWDFIGATGPSLSRISVKWPDGAPFSIYSGFSTVLTTFGPNPIFGAWLYMTLGVVQNFVLCAVTFRGAQGKFSTSVATTFAVDNTVTYRVSDVSTSSYLSVRNT